jgi:hypothetical protein
LTSPKRDAIFLKVLIFKERAKMYSHVVLYQVNPLNPYATAKIVEKANLLLKRIPGIQYFHAGRVIDTSRAVGKNDYAVLLNLIFLNSHRYYAYMQHAQHLEFVRFVLNGYVLVGSRNANPEKEFIEYILKGGEPRNWVPNPSIAERDVVWVGEAVFDAR